MDTFVHEYVSPINRYKAVSVRQGFNAHEVFLYDDRECYITQTLRLRNPYGGWMNKYQVKFLDGTTAFIPAGKFAKGVKAVPFSPIPRNT